MAESPLWTPSTAGEDPMSILSRLVEQLKPWLETIDSEAKRQPTYLLSAEQRFLGELALQQLGEQAHELHESDEVSSALQEKLGEHCWNLYNQGPALGEQLFPAHATIIVEAFNDVQEALRHQPRPGQYL